jgi:uncharacterized repeat protein (TIGR01451 family)
MTATISRLYNSYADAKEAVRNLEAAGVPHNDISIIASNADNWYSSDHTREQGTFPDRDLDGKDDRAEAAGAGAGVGAAVGGTAGFTMTVSNTGTGPATGVTLSDALPAGLTLPAGNGGIVTLTAANTCDEMVDLAPEGHGFYLIDPMPSPVLYLVEPRFPLGLGDRVQLVVNPGKVLPA